MIGRFSEKLLGLTNFQQQLLILLYAKVLFVPFLGGVHLFDWDEINFAESAREMLVSGNYLQVQINFSPFFEKPPLFIWFQVASMKLFGVNEFAARFPNAICGLFSLLFLFNAGKRLHSVRFGFIWVLVYSGSFLPHIYFKSGIIDPFFNLFIMSSLYFFFLVEPDSGEGKGTNSGSSVVKAGLISGFLAGLAVLTKGPVALLLVGLTAALVFVFRASTCSFNRFKWFALSFVPVALSWYVAEIIWFGPAFVAEFIDYHLRLLSTEDAGHGGPIIFHPIVLLLGCFPASIFALETLFRPKSRFQLADWVFIALLLVVVVIFSLVQTKIIHYSSLAYFPATYLASRQIENANAGLSKVSRALLAVIGGIWGLAILLLPFVGRLKSYILPYIKDPFALGNLEAEVDWPVFLAIPGILLFVAIARAVRVQSIEQISRAYAGLFFVSLIVVQFLLYTIVPRVEAISQRAAIVFFKSKAEEECNLETLGYKSYAHFFYGKVMPEPETVPPENNARRFYLLNSATALPHYFSVKVHRAEKYLEMHDLEEIGRKNGFVFLKKPPTEEN